MTIDKLNPAPSTMRDTDEHLRAGTIWQDKSDSRHIVRLETVEKRGNTDGVICSWLTIEGDAGSNHNSKTHRDNFLNRFTWLAASEEDYRKTSQVA